MNHENAHAPTQPDARVIMKMADHVEMRKCREGLDVNWPQQQKIGVKQFNGNYLHHLCILILNLVNKIPLEWDFYFCNSNFSNQALI